MSVRTVTETYTYLRQSMPMLAQQTTAMTL
jgi:hypothetical protein